MALQAASVKPVIQIYDEGTASWVSINVGIVKTLNPTASTASISEKGIGGIIKERLSTHEYKWGWEGLPTSYKILQLGLPNDSGIPPELKVYMHDLLLEGALIATETIEGGEGKSLSYSFDGVAKQGSSATPLAYSDPGIFFVYSDATITFGDETGEIKEFKLEISRDVKAIYGTSMDPQDWQIGTTSYSGSFTISSDTMAKVLEGAWDETNTSFTFTIKFVDPTNASRYIQIDGSGCMTNEASISLDPDSDVAVVKSIKFESLAVTGADG